MCNLRSFFRFQISGWYRQIFLLPAKNVSVWTECSHTHTHRQHVDACLVEALWLICDLHIVSHQCSFSFALKLELTWNYCVCLSDLMLFNSINTFFSFSIFCLLTSLSHTPTSSFFFSGRDVWGEAGLFAFNGFLRWLGYTHCHTACQRMVCVLVPAAPPDSLHGLMCSCVISNCVQLCVLNSDQFVNELPLHCTLFRPGVDNFLYIYIYIWGLQIGPFIIGNWKFSGLALL